MNELIIVNYILQTTHRPVHSSKGDSWMTPQGGLQADQQVMLKKGVYSVCWLIDKVKESEWWEVTVKIIVVEST